ncbi:MAG TPA: TetR/AcrR family transcriptional regulator [Thermoanaerobaculia bacterium]|nr:TetR/AcrR family transcriptional regulator [Thermoanaerobaculia bacterium]
MVEKEDRKSLRRERTRAEILDATRSVVRRRGLAGFTLDDVAKQMGLTKAALYYYFRSKDDLAFELLLEEWQLAAEAVAEAVQEAEDGARALEALVKAYVGHFRDRPEMFLLTHAEIARADTSHLVGQAQLARIRPLNELFYGTIERKLQADRAAGRVGRLDNPRRLAFVAQLAAVGLLTFKIMVEAVGDPLRYGDDELVEEINGLLRRALPTPEGES